MRENRHIHAHSQWDMTPNQIPLTYAAGAAAVFGSRARWTRETGQLHLSVQVGHSLAAGKMYNVSVELHNPGHANTESVASGLRWRNIGLNPPAKVLPPGFNLYNSILVVSVSVSVSIRRCTSMCISLLMYIMCIHPFKHTIHLSIGP